MKKINKSHKVFVLLLVFSVIWIIEPFTKKAVDPFESLEYVDGHLLNRKLLSLPENRWIKIYPQSLNLVQQFSIENVLGSGLSWHRQGHAGLAFDTKRKSLLTFGSDSHGENWDNRVHEFNLLTLKWIEHYPISPKETYRADNNGYAVAGKKTIFPWAMHTYDNIAYVPEMDSLIVTSKIDHTPRPTEKSKNARFNPTWMYDLKTKEWKILDQKDAPSFFSSGSSYDPVTSSLWAYKHGSLWQLDIAQQQWRKIPGNHKTDLTGHYTMTTDSQRHQLVFFGNYNKSNSIWIYKPGILADQDGKWEKKHPGGDFCPKDAHFPVAYDSHQGVFLLVPDENAKKSVTLLYLPENNTYLKIENADMPPNGMNYMMEYDPYHHLFLLVTGDWKSPVTVWAFHLNLDTINGGEE